MLLRVMISVIILSSLQVSNLSLDNLFPLTRWKKRPSENFNGPTHILSLDPQQWKTVS